MKNIKAFILLVLLFTINLSARWSHEINGKIVEAGPGYTSDQINIIVKNDLNGVETTFKFWIGQFGINSYEELIMKNVNIQYISGKAPLAIGVAEYNPNAISAPHFDSIDDKYYSMDDYYFIGRYVQANSINYKIVLEIEGSNGRIGSFPIPDNVVWPDEDQDPFSNKEVLVRYVLLDELIITELRVKPDEEVTKGEFVFTGNVLSAEDTGLGPFYGISVENPETKESSYFMLMLGMFNKVKSYEDMVGDNVEISYDTYDDFWLDKIGLLTGSYQDSTDSENNIYYLTGVYEDGVNGDMGGYLYIRTTDDERTTIMTEWATFDEFIGKEVYVKYHRESEKEVRSLKILK